MTRGAAAATAALALVLGGCAPSSGDTTTTTQPAETPGVAPSNAPPRTLPPPPESDVCDGFAQPVALGTIATAELRETSGIVASRTHPGVLWAHNDSGDAAAVHAVGTDGSDLGRFRLTNALAIDWEDMSLGPGPEPDRDYLYIGDIGDNLLLRSRLPIYRVPEPVPDRSGGSLEDVEVLTVTYGELGSFNAEAMAIDRFGRDLYIITKRGDDGRSVVFRVALADLVPGGVALLDPVAVLDLGPGAEVTGADITADGGLIALRGYSEVWIWTRVVPGAAETFATEPCLAPSPDEIQGEAIAFDPDGLGYFTVSEGSRAAINYVGPRSP